MRVVILCLIIIVAKIAWNLQQSSTNFDINDFLKDSTTGLPTTERLGHFVALWVTTVAFCFMLTFEDVDKVNLFLYYGGMWITSRAVDKFGERPVPKKAPDVVIDAQTATVQTPPAPVAETKDTPNA